MSEQESGAEIVRDLMTKIGGVELVDGADNIGYAMAPRLVSVPEGRRIEDLRPYFDKYAGAPRRRMGTALMQDVESIITWGQRNKSALMVLFVDQDEMALNLVSNYHAQSNHAEAHEDPAARWGDHRAVYGMRLSREWRRWKSVDGKALSRDELADFVEDHALDFMDPTPALISGEGASEAELRLVEMARRIDGRWGQYARLRDLAANLRIYETSNLEVKANRDSGETTLSFVNEHKDPEGKPLSLPNLYQLAIPVIERGPLFRIPLRFQYRKRGQNVQFTLSLIEPDRARELTLDEAAAQVVKALDVPLIRGKPEKTRGAEV
ncbi:MAG: YfdQ family protein [Neomegalonema sp.]|nr:YfdQ family protein [Neomegalonema sp.]